MGSNRGCNQPNKTFKYNKLGVNLVSSPSDQYFHSKVPNVTLSMIQVCFNVITRTLTLSMSKIRIQQ